MTEHKLNWIDSNDRLQRSAENAPKGTIYFGKYWAAVRDERVVGVIAMRVPRDVDFEEYRCKAAECLQVLGEVKAGEVIERDGERYFVKRLTHANRGKSPRQAKEYRLYKPRNH